MISWRATESYELGCYLALGHVDPGGYDSLILLFFFKLESLIFYEISCFEKVD